MSADDWFGPHVNPNAAIAEYRSAPPRGMTNPPQNPKVRAMLLRELEEYGVQLEVESWPPPAPDLTASFNFGALTAPPESRNPGARAAQELARKHMTWLRDGDTRAIANRLADNLVEYEKSRSRPGSRPASRPGSGASGKTGGKLAHSASAPALGAGSRRQKDSKEQKDGKGKGAGKGTVSQKGLKDAGAKQAARPGSSGQRHSSKDKIEKTTASEPARQDMQNGGEAGDDAWQAKKKVPRVLSESELHNGIAALRSQGRLHRAAVGDRFRFGADLMAAGGMVLKGAGATPVAPGVWASDASELVKFHNKAIRLVNPSHLALLPVETKKKKKKKVDEDELAMGARSLYQADKSYRNIRKIRRSFYPDSFEREKTAKEHAIATVTGLMSGIQFTSGGATT
eukprot:gb/GFBE01029920.1/.p1 GENE.gb/GFBE01029920.1/~~gb/GFBE01029920.1/.p1  ORF type:complete len:399 (+),score=89.37 gb/GFBE01029920.1/:1-1197(+)